jgi:hypothetical protein
MSTFTLATAIVMGALVLAAPSAQAQESPAPDVAVIQPAVNPPQPMVRGWQLMSDDERAHYRATMRGLETPEERERLRKAIHETMKIRARERGLTLPDEPPARGNRP